MTLANFTRSLLFAAVLLLGGAAAVAADEPDDGLLGGALGGAADLVEAGAETVTDLPVVEDLPVATVVAPVVERVVEPAPAVVAPVTKVVAPVVEAAAKPAAPRVKTVVATAAPAVEAVAPVVEPVAKPVARALRPVARPIEQVAPVTKTITENVATPIVEALIPVTESVAPVVKPLVPILDTATEVVRPVTDPVGGVLPPVLGPVGVGGILDPVLRPRTAVSAPPDTVTPPSVGTSRGAGADAQTAVITDARPDVATTHEHVSAPGAVGRSGRHHSAATDAAHASMTRSGIAQAPVPLAAIAAELVGSSPDGGFTIVILAAMALAVVASRSALSAPGFARPPSLAFAPAVPPA